MKFTRTVKFTEYVIGYVDNMEIHEVTRVEKVGRLGRSVLAEVTKECGHKAIVLNTIKHEKRYECSLEKFLEIATEIPLEERINADDVETDEF